MIGDRETLWKQGHDTEIASRRRGSPGNQIAAKRQQKAPSSRSFKYANGVLLHHVLDRQDVEQLNLFGGDGMRSRGMHAPWSL
jgi:hypothetical protein